MNREPKFNFNLCTPHAWLKQIVPPKHIKLIHTLGLEYDPCKKLFYTDRHEKPETILYWSIFLDI